MKIPPNRDCREWLAEHFSSTSGSGRQCASVKIRYFPCAFAAPAWHKAMSCECSENSTRVGGKLIQQGPLLEIRRNDKYRFVHRSGDGLVVPAFPAMLPLAAVKLEGTMIKKIRGEADHRRDQRHMMISGCKNHRGIARFEIASFPILHIGRHVETADLGTNDRTGFERYRLLRILKDVRHCLQEIGEIASLPSRSRISLLRQASGRFGRGLAGMTFFTGTGAGRPLGRSSRL